MCQVRVLFALRVAVGWNGQSSVNGHLDIAVETDGGVEDSVESNEGYGSVWLLVHIETQGVLVEIKQHADYTAGLNAAVRTVRVLAVVHEPTALRVDVHAPTLVILACRQMEVTCYLR